ncbi:MAG: porphobilinogen synthase [Bradymonadales bacterium]|nr:MAG: porphobilinogen synthase [Bradymonadales bacterium]
MSLELLQRPRRLRQNPLIRSLAQETDLRAKKFLLPIFVCEGNGIEKVHPSLSGCVTRSLDRLIPFLKNLEAQGVGGILLFGVSQKKDEGGSEAIRKDNIVVRSIREIRESCPQLLVGTDIALDPYTDHGHDGIYRNGVVLNDESVQRLCEMSCLHAEAGAHLLAPSDMMDGRIQEIRESLDEEAYQNTLLMSYTAKYASCFYGPFRDSLGAKVEGNKRSYQMNPANRKEALRELELDLSEGADIVMVKPASHYLDIISDFKERSLIPVAAYQVSGECAMIELGAKQGLFDRDHAIYESCLSISRAGADLIASYFASEIPRILAKMDLIQ